MEQRLSLVTLGVTDLARSRTFYDRLGWREAPASTDSVAFFQAGGVVLSLYGRSALAADAQVPNTPAPAGAFTGIALAHNVRTRAEVAQVLADAVAAGGRLLKPAQDAFWGGHSGYFADPDGHVREVAWNPFFPFDEAGNLRLPT
ncbi:MAG TPA: VOC family protein [Azospirillaceae bacterium]|nr:VOC family protein [Azospirillaceae bacterium]